MKTPLALHNLLHQAAKTSVSVGGVAFALLLVFMQLGFMGAVSDTAANVLSKLQFDVVIRARDYLHLYEPGMFDRKWLKIAENTQGVSRAHPLWITVNNWRTMPNSEDAPDYQSEYRPIAVMAYDPLESLFASESLDNANKHLRSSTSLLLDDSTQPEYGPSNGKRYTTKDVGRTTEIGGQQFEISGLFELGTGLAANGAVMLNERGFARVMPYVDTQTQASLGLVQLDDAGREHIEETVDLLRTRTLLDQASHTTGQLGWLHRIAVGLGRPEPLPEGVAVDIMSKEDAISREKYRWLWQTPIGLIFQLGVVLSMFVGAAIVYMVLSTDVANRLPEYATLLAIGYSRGYLASIVMTQALVLSVLGFLSAWGIAEILYRVTSTVSAIPLNMTSTRVIQVAVLGVFMCCLSGLLALRKLWKAEPASLF